MPGHIHFETFHHALARWTPPNTYIGKYEDDRCCDSMSYYTHPTANLLLKLSLFYLFITIDHTQLLIFFKYIIILPLYSYLLGISIPNCWPLPNYIKSQIICNIERHIIFVCNFENDKYLPPSYCSYT